MDEAACAWAGPSQAEPGQAAVGPVHGTERSSTSLQTHVARRQITPRFHDDGRQADGAGVESHPGARQSRYPGDERGRQGERLSAEPRPLPPRTTARAHTHTHTHTLSLSSVCQREITP